tara:strand:- start:129 stop:290 length:162 start_codon:yes stop_codon:yes gene_type:complete
MIEKLKTSYVKFWVPFFGRILSRFIHLIEGSSPIKKPTFKFENNDCKNQKDKE